MMTPELHRRDVGMGSSSGEHAARAIAKKSLRRRMHRCATPYQGIGTLGVWAYGLRQTAFWLEDPGR
jgi:hypothetical protein